MNQLTQEQELCVRWPADGHLLIKGIPGSGKSTVLIRRAQRLQREGTPACGGPKVLFITFNALLARYLQGSTIAHGGHEGFEVTTFFRWAYKLLADVGIRRPIVTGQERDEFLRFARNSVSKYHPELVAPPLYKGDQSWSAIQAQVEFLSEEVSWIKGQGLSADAYLTGPRVGRGLALRREYRNWVWRVYETYQALLESRKRLDFDDFALLLDQNADRIPMESRPGHVLVDEAQDLSPVQLRVIAKVTLHTLTIAADKGQSIYSRGFSWAQLGIDIRGSRSRSLNWTFRSTSQIVGLAQSLQRHDPLVQRQDPELIPPTLPTAQGPVPVLFMAPDVEAETRQLVQWVERVRTDFPDESVGVIVPTSHIAKRFADAFSVSGLQWIYLGTDATDFDERAIKILTFHAAKGLEFDHVAVTSLREGLLPARGKELSDEEMDEFIATERRKLYVAITRARTSLALFASNPVSRFVTELDPSLYVKVGTHEL